MMLVKKHRILAATILGALLLLGLYVLFDKPFDRADIATTTTTKLGDGLGIQVTGDATITELPAGSSLTKPSLDRPVSFEGSVLPPDAQTVVRAKLTATIASLKKDPSNLSLWLELGFYRKQAGDYKGAEEAWLYVNMAAEKDEVSANNLADLYMNFLKDYPKAELFYKKVISYNPKNIDAYNNLYMLYKYLYKTNTSSATDIKAQALKAFPNDAGYISTW